MKQNYLQNSIVAIWAIAFLLVAYSCSQIETFEPNMDSNDLAKDISKFKLTGPLVEPINWAMRGRPDGTPGQDKDKDPNGGNVECSELDMEYASSSGRNNYNDGEFENEWPEGLEVEVIDGKVYWKYTAPEGYCLASMAIIVKGGPAANVYIYPNDMCPSEDKGLVAPDNASGKPADLSNLTFCWNLVETPEAPTSDGDQNECEDDVDGKLTASATASPGATIVWYTAATGGSIVDDPSLDQIGEVTYWAEAQIGSCVSSERTPVTLKIRDCSDNGGGDYCGSDTAFSGPEGEILDSKGWFYLMVYAGVEVSYPLWGGRDIEVGEVTLTPNGTDVDVTVTLKPGVELQEKENWFVHGYTEAPKDRPRGGQKGDAVTWDKGTAVSAPFTVSVPRNGATIFAVHINVQKECDED
jgi:hypothetical protein